uniref:Uncharacterized protein n=1 Tax=Nicotiana tabacum TaxID=4097 RepID=A0A1S4BP88_TOBAC|nr:PREDICTED: uncharacterized protein LOC107810427 [Nicotiana tabacum]
MSTDTIIKDEDSFVSNTDAIIYAASDISGWTQSLISDPNIPNSSNSTSVDDLHCCCCCCCKWDLSTVVVCSNKDDEEDKGSESNKRLKSSAESEFDGGLLAEIGGAANKETSVRLVNNLDTADALVRDIRIRGGSNVIKNT